MPSSDSAHHLESPSSRAENLFFAALSAAGQVDIGALCTAHPDLAVELREVHTCWRLGSEALSQPTDPSQQAVIADRYEVRTEIASGGMGTVLEVWDRNLARRLAMKLVRADRRPLDPDEWRRRQARLHNEAQVLGQLVHPGILPLHDVGETAAGDRFFTMQLVRGKHLGALIDACHAGSSPWTLTRLLGALLRVVEAMAYAHSQGVLHRDLKPSNVMVGPFGETYVLDWGLAKVLDPARNADPDTPALGPEDADATRTIAGQVVGTPAFMAPEQAEGVAVDARADVYAAGAILYNLLTGESPYQGEAESPAQLLEVVRSRPPRTPDAVRLAVPAELVSITQRAMARDPSARYPSMQELAEDLRAYLEVRVVRAHATGALVELRKWIRRNRAAATAVAILLLGLGVGLLVQHRANERLRRQDYRNKVALASHALAAGDIVALRLLLDGCDPALRGWEWHAIDRLSDLSDATFDGAQGVILCGEFAPDGQLVAVGGRDRKLRVHDCETGKVRAEFAFAAFVDCLDFVGPRRVLAVAEGKLWDLDIDAGSRRQIGTRPDRILTCALSPDGARLLLGVEPGRVEVWDSALQELQTTLLEGLHGVSQVAWSRDGTDIFVCGRDREDDGERNSLMRIFAAETLAPRFPGMAGHGDWIQQVAESPDGQRIATSGWDGRVLVWDTESGALLYELPKVWSGRVALAWAPDGRLVTGGRPLIEFWRGRIREGHFAGHQDYMNALSTHGDRLMSAGADGRVKLWSLAGTHSRAGARTAGVGKGLDVDPERQRFVVSGDVGQVAIWDGRRREVARNTGIPCRRTLVKFAKTRDELVLADGGGWFWRADPHSGATHGYVRAHQDSAAGLDVHPREGLAGTTGVDGWVKLWRLDDLKELWALRVGTADWPPGAQECRFSPDGAQLAVGANDDRLRLVATATGRVIQELRAGPGIYSTPTFSPDGRQLAARVWRTKSRLVVWDLDTGEVLWELPGTQHAFISPRFSSDGTRLFACTEKGTLTVLDAQDGARYASLTGPSNRRVFALEVLGELVIASSNDALRFWDGTSR